MNQIPRLSLAPMQDVSVLALWRCMERRGGADFYVTEYFRVHRDSQPERKILRSIVGLSGEKPVYAQMIGNDPEHLVRTAKLIQEQSDCAGIDVNLGCPAPKVCGKAAGGALLKNHELIREIALSLREVVTGSLTLKTRVGFESTDEFEELLSLFADLPIDGLAIHGRTVRERYQSAVHVDCIARAVDALPFPVSANGSIVSVRTALAMREQTGAAGLMIGRGGIRNPWLFSQVRCAAKGEKPIQPTLADVGDYLEELTEEVAREGNFGDQGQLANRMKKFANYIAIGIAEGELVDQLRRTKGIDEFLRLSRDYLVGEEAFPDEPVEDGKLFCGAGKLLTGEL